MRGAAVLAAGMVLFAAAPAARAASVVLTCPASARVGEEFVVGVVADVGVRPLGAYGIDVYYDGTRLAVAALMAGAAAEFAESPFDRTVCDDAGGICVTALSAFQATRSDGPLGIVSLAYLRFTALRRGPRGTRVGLAVRALLDTDAEPIVPVVGEGDCVVRVRR